MAREHEPYREEDDYRPLTAGQVGRENDDGALVVIRFHDGTGYRWFEMADDDAYHDERKGAFVIDFDPPTAATGASIHVGAVVENITADETRLFYGCSSISEKIALDDALTAALRYWSLDRGEMAALDVVSVHPVKVGEAIDL